MRTEEQLRQTFAALAEQAPAPEAVLRHLDTQQRRPAPRPRRAALVLAAVVVVVLALVLPAILTTRTGEPADGRVPGNWNLVHRIQPVQGSSAREQVVLANSELSIVDFGSDEVGDCSVEVHGPQASPMPRARSGDVATQVHGQDAHYRNLPRGPSLNPANPERGGLYWAQPGLGWVLVACDPGLQRHLDLAERVVFEPVTVRLPFRMRALPENYRALSVVPVRSSTGVGQEVGVGLEPIEPDSLPMIAIEVTTGTADADRPGLEQATVAGLPAIFDVTQRSLCLDTQDHSVCVADGRDPATTEPSTSPWPAGYRERLVEVAESVELATDLSDQDTWFPANQALPS